MTENGLSTEAVDDGERPEEDLADDVIFEPSIIYPGKKVGVAIKGGVQVCWSCFEPIQGKGFFDAIMGESALVRICDSNNDCRNRVSTANMKREERLRDGKIILLDTLNEQERVDLMKEIKEKKKKLKD